MHALLLALLFAAAAVPGKTAPPFLLDTLDGQTMTLADLHGRPVFINVFASWCGPCKHELPMLIRASKRYRNVRFIFIDEQEPPGAVRRAIARYGIPGPVALDDGPFEAAYGAASIPESIFIDAHGVVRLVYRGPIPATLLQKTLQP